MDQDQDGFPGVAAAEADVVQAAVVAQGDDAGVVDAVVADAVVAGVDRGAGGDGFRAGGVGLRGCPPAQRAVRPDLVVVVPELVEQRLQLPDGGGSGLVVEPFLQSLVEALDFSAGLRVIGARDEEGVVLGSLRVVLDARNTRAWPAPSALVTFTEPVTIPV